MFTFAPLVDNSPNDDAFALVRAVATPFGGVSIVLVRLT